MRRDIRPHDSIGTRIKAFLCLGLAVISGAQEGGDPTQIQKHLAEVQARLTQVDTQLGALKNRRKGLLVEMQNISLQADRARAEADGARLQQEQTKTEVHQIKQRKEDINRELEQLRDDVRRQIRWMHALGPWGGLSLFPSLASFGDFLVRDRYLTYFRNQQRRKLDRVQNLQKDLAIREQELQGALQKLSTIERTAAQSQISLRLSEERLQSFLDNMRQDEAKQKAVQAELAEEALQLERMLAGVLGKSKSDAYEATVSFVSLRGELPKPVDGTVAQAFGEHLHPKFKTKTAQSGLLIATTQGAQVAAVADGRVVFADIYQSYGPMVILDHGGGYFTLYTHLRAFSVAKGQTLHAGERLGSAGDTLEGPRLGFEVRHLTQPQDPQKWLQTKYR